MKAYKKLMDWIAVLEKLILSVVLAFITAVTFVNVVVRKLTNGQFAWTEELVINLFVLTIMLGCALSIREGGMISLSLIYDRVGPKVKKVFASIITAANLVFWTLLLKTGADKVLSQVASGKRTSILNWPEWVFTIFLPIGAAILILHTIEYFLDVMTAREGGIDQ